MQIQRILLTTFLLPLLVMLYGCEPKESTQQHAMPVPDMPAVQQHGTANTSTTAASKAEFTKLAKDTGCFACHSIDKKLLGPAWKHVAGIYRNDPAAEAKMMNKIAKGGSGVWGRIEMPAYPNLSEEKRRVLAKFILSLE